MVHRGEHPVRHVRFRQKLAMRRHILVFGHAHPGRDNDLDGWPSFLHCGRELQPVDRAGHINIGDYQSNVASRFEYFDRIIRVRGRNNLVARIFEHPSQKWLTSGSSSTVSITVILEQQTATLLVPAAGLPASRLVVILQIFDGRSETQRPRNRTSIRRFGRTLKHGCRHIHG